MDSLSPKSFADLIALVSGSFREGKLSSAAEHRLYSCIWLCVIKCEMHKEVGDILDRENWHELVKALETEQPAPRKEN